MSHYISTSQELADKTIVGGKGANLQKLVSWGANVSEFIILTTSTHEAYASSGLPNEVIQEIESFIGKHKMVSLRSSMTSEDQLDASFAGMFDTFLNVTKLNWQELLSRIYASVNNERVREYLAKKNLPTDLKMAVVIQRQVNVDRSGVIFTRSPVPPTSAIAIDAAFGMGEGVVSGRVDVDHYQLMRSGEILAENFKYDLPVLSYSEIKSLSQLAVTLETHLGHPADIEWGYEGDKLYIFQVRPITQMFSPLGIFVDTNLSESYPGIVSPFTANFVKLAYRNVYRESAVLLGASKERLKNLTYHYERLISSVDHHLYYNLEHYYAVLRALPGGEKNIHNWHKMIGGDPSRLTVPYHATALSRKETLMTIFHLGKLAYQKNKVFQKFQSNLERIRSEIDLEFDKLKTSDEALKFMHKLLNESLGFGLTVVNDVFIMIALGILRYKFKKKGIAEEELINLIKTSDELDSIKPLETLNTLVTKLDHEFFLKFKELRPEGAVYSYFHVFDGLRKAGYEKEVKLINIFLDEYGDRSFEELKLESLPFKNNPALLYDLMFWLKNNPYKKPTLEDQKVEWQFSKWEQKVINFTKECIALREATRLWRGKFYHVIRENIILLSKLLSKEDSSWKEFDLLDFFSITHVEWNDFQQKKIKKEEIQKLMRQRKIWKGFKRQYPEVLQWSSEEPIPNLKNEIDANNSIIKGQGVSSGMIEGVALVLESPLDIFDQDLKDFILVTKNTDPAWVYIMSRSSGLISEKGSLLSHTAIIGRELGIPTVVGVAGATKLIKSGDKIRINGQSGEIEKV